MNVTKKDVEQLRSLAAAELSAPSLRELLLRVQLELSGLRRELGAVVEPPERLLAELERRRAAREAGESLEQVATARAFELLADFLESTVESNEPAESVVASAALNNPARGRPNRQGPNGPWPSEYCGDCSPIANEKFSKLHGLGRCDCWCHRALV